MSWPSKRTSPETLDGSTSPARASINSVWPLPSTPAMPTISPARTSKETSLTRAGPSAGRTERWRTVSFVSPGVAARLSTRSRTSRPTIRRASSAAFVSPGLQTADDAAVAHDRHLIRNREHLGQFVGDDDDGFSLLPHAAEDDEEFLDFLRGQHGRRLIENQQPGLAVERFQQFDPLLLADRQRVDDRMRIDGQLELVGQAADVGSRRREIELQRRARLRSRARCFPPPSSARPA